MIDELIARLRKVESSRGPYRGQAGVTTNWHKNPDGPEAADTIKALRAERDALREAYDDLRRYIYDKTPERRERSIERYGIAGATND